MSARWVTFFLWMAVAASLVAWGLKLFVTEAATPGEVVVAQSSQAARGDPARVLGVDPVAVADTPGQPEAPQDSRFQLLGVMAPRPGQAPREGVALIAVNGQAPKAFRVGARVDGDTVLRAVRARGADLGPAQGAPTTQLEIPPPPPAATGTLPPATAGGAPTAPMAQNGTSAPGAPGARPMLTPGRASPGAPPLPPAAMPGQRPGAPHAAPPQPGYAVQQQMPQPAVAPPMAEPVAPGALQTR